MDPALLTKFSLPQALAVTTTDRRALCAVRDRLEAELNTPADRDLIDVVVSKMLKGFELGRGMSDLDAQMLREEYIEAVKKLPLWAIKGAAERFRGKETILKWNPAYRPSSAEFAAEAREGMIPQRTKLLHTRRVLEAEVEVEVSEKDRAKVEQLHAEYRSVAGVRDPERAKTPSELSQLREATLKELGSRLCANSAGGGLDHLMARLDQRKAARSSSQGFNGEGVQP